MVHAVISDLQASATMKSANIEADFIHEVEAWIHKEEAEGRRPSGCAFGFVHKVSEPSILNASFAREVEAWLFKEEAEGRRSSGCRFGFANKTNNYAVAEGMSLGLEATSTSETFPDVASTATAMRCQVPMSRPAASTAASTTVGGCIASSTVDGTCCRSPDTDHCAHPEPLLVSAAAAGLQSTAEPSGGQVTGAASNDWAAWRPAERCWVHFVWYKWHPEFDFDSLLIGGLRCNLITAVSKTFTKLWIRGHRYERVSILLAETAASDYPDNFRRAVEITIGKLKYLRERYMQFCMQRCLPLPTKKRPCFSVEAYSRHGEVLLKDLLASWLHPNCAKVIDRVTAGSVASHSLLLSSAFPSPVARRHGAKLSGNNLLTAVQPCESQMQPARITWQQQLCHTRPGATCSIAMTA